MRFVGLVLPMEMTKVGAPLPSYKMLFDLPGYCYDMHNTGGTRNAQAAGARSPGSGRHQGFLPGIQD